MSFQNIDEKKEINIFSQCYDYLYEYHLKYHKELDFTEIKNYQMLQKVILIKLQF